jgi:hypothetical protein
VPGLDQTKVKVSPSKISSECGRPSGDSNPLPLFREEAIAAQRQDVFGQVVRIRPFSSAFLIVLLIGLVLILYGLVHWRTTIGGCAL